MRVSVIDQPRDFAVGYNVPFIKIDAGDNAAAFVASYAPL
jgi:hypothetical protein